MLSQTETYLDETGAYETPEQSTPIRGNRYTHVYERLILPSLPETSRLSPLNDGRKCN
jgi:hypothetical protein